MTAAKRGKSMLSRYLAERNAQREAERDRPDASASPPAEAATATVARTTPGVGREHKVRKTRMDAFLDRIGVLPDSEIAALAKVTVTNVYGYRLRHGIPAPPRKARIAVEPAVETPVPAVEAVPAPVVAVVPEPVAVQFVGKPDIDTPAGMNLRTVRLTDRVEGMLEALAKMRGINPESAISVAIAEDYLRCQALIRSD